VKAAPAASASSLLDGDTLRAIRSRAPGYDERNEFFTEDLAQLKALGYLAPRGLSDTVADQRLLAAHAPATALGVGMHLTWMGVARDMVAQGFTEFQWILDAGHAGEVFAFGVSERGNARVLADSTTVVSKTPEGYAFTGTKIFVSLSPAWTKLSLLGRHGDTIVHGFIDRATPGWSNTPDWDTLGMRATQSYTTTLQDVVVRDDRVVRVIPVGESGDPFTAAVFQNFLPLVSAVYAGIADRALELAVAGVKEKTSAFDPGQRVSDDPDRIWRWLLMLLAHSLPTTPGSLIRVRPHPPSGSGCSRGSNTTAWRPRGVWWIGQCGLWAAGPTDALTNSADCSATCWRVSTTRVTQRLCTLRSPTTCWGNQARNPLAARLRCEHGFCKGQ